MFSKLIVFLLAVIHQTTTGTAGTPRCNCVFLLAVIHQTTTTGEGQSNFLGVFLLAVIHQTTTSPTWQSHSRLCFYWRLYIKPQRHQRLGERRPLCFYWRLYIKPQPHDRMEVLPTLCFYWRLYIKPQRRKCKGLKDNEITSAEFSKKWRCKYLIVAKLLKKFQLYRLRDFLFLDGSPNIDNVAVLSICNGQNAYFAMLRYR